MFTSRLPISTSVRRPNPAENRPSNIPVTVQKANLFTPQTKRPFSAGTSTAGKSFTSGTATERKFQRSLKPVPDRDSQQRMFDNLTDFLRNQAPGFPCPEAKKFFSSVSTTESSRIFEFLISRLLPDFKVSRLEVDVPEALATLDYPYIRSVTKSSLVSVTTRQAAAGLLHIFDWLIRIIPTTDEGDLINDDEPMNERQMALMNSVLHPESAYEENRKLLAKMHSSDDVDQLENELEFGEEEFHRLQQQLQDIQRLEQDRTTLWDDIKKCRDYEAQMTRYLQTKVEESAEIEQCERDLQFQLEEDIRQVDQLKQEINKHKLDIDQANREHENLCKLEQTLQTFRDQLAQADAGWRLIESKYQRLLDGSQEWSSEHSDQLRELIDLASSIAYLGSINFELPESLDTEENIRSTISHLNVKNSELNPILASKRSDEAAELQLLEATDAKYSSEVFPRLHQENDRIDRKLEDLNRQYASIDSTYKSRIDHLDRQASEKDKEVLEKLRNLQKMRDVEIQLQESENRDCEHFLNSSKSNLQNYLETCRQRVLIVKKDSHQKAEDWNEIAEAWEEQKTIVNKAYKLLKRPLGLS